MTRTELINFLKQTPDGCPSLSEAEVLEAPVDVKKLLLILRALGLLFNPY